MEEYIAIARAPGSLGGNIYLCKHSISLPVRWQDCMHKAIRMTKSDFFGAKLRYPNTEKDMSLFEGACMC